VEIKRSYYNSYVGGQMYSERYLLDGKVHRQDGPAEIYYYNNNGKIQSEHYWINGECHRENGPARIWYYNNGKIINGEYYLNGEYITNEFKILVMKTLEIENTF